MTSPARRAQKLAVAKPLYSQVRDLLLERINRGDWGAAGPLPNEFRLSSDFGVSIGTIRRAVEELEEAGIVVRKQGRGTYLSGSANQGPSGRFSALRLSNGDRPTLTYQLESKSRRLAASEEIAGLALAPSAEVVAIGQLLLHNGEVVGHEHVALDAKRFPNFERQLQYGQDLSPLYLEYSAIVTSVADQIAIATAPDHLSLPLQVQPGANLLKVLRIARNLEEEVIEYKTGWYRPDRVLYFTEVN